MTDLISRCCVHTCPPIILCTKQNGTVRHHTLRRASGSEEHQEALKRRDGRVLRGACIQSANQQPAIQQPYNNTTIPYNHTTMQPANPKPKIPIPPVSTQTSMGLNSISKSRLVWRILVSFPIHSIWFTRDFDFKSSTGNLLFFPKFQYWRL